MNYYERWGKRALDITISAAGIAACLPLWAMIAAGIKATSRGPVLFRQDRMGRGGKPFTLFKFRTMRCDAFREEAQFEPGSSDRVTSFGRILRAGKLDELPQLLNVLRGDMSLVGPRPEVPAYRDAYAGRFQKVLEIRPGMTSRASVLYRNEQEILARSQQPGRFYRELILARKLEFDLSYAGRRRSFGEDLGILLETAYALLGTGSIRNYRRLRKEMSVDTAVIITSFALAFLVRFEGMVPEYERGLFLICLPVLIAVRVTFYSYFGLYYQLWRYAGMRDGLNVLKAVAAGSGTFILVLVFARGLVGFPRSVFVIEFLLTLLLTGSARLYSRFRSEGAGRGTRPGDKRLLIVGAGEAGSGILREISHNPELNYQVVGFVDDKPAKRNRWMQGIPVLGTRKDIEEIVLCKGVEEIVIAIPSASREQLRSLVDICQRTGARVRILPALGDLIDGKVSITQAREVRIEDLLGREVVKLNDDTVREYIEGQDVLVTGAGGSIGSEICRQTLKYRPRSLILLGRGENSIFKIYNELSAMRGNCALVQVIGDIINKHKVERLFEKFRPRVVFHAGADKHVPLMELNPDEAVLNNIIGTKNVIEAAEAAGAAKVICISTDKAADPSCVMGCTKRIAELVVRSRRPAATTTIGVRFGNVLGSRGSVIPVFREQILNGGPVTVTDKRMVRYFMTIPEAAQLVMKSGAIGTCGSIYVLDMGEPMRILDLACQMIRLSGHEPYKDIPIVFKGIRPGEKLVESLTGQGERLLPTGEPKIFGIQPSLPVPPGLEEGIGELRRLAIGMDEEGILDKLREIVPTFTPPAREEGPRKQRIPLKAPAGAWAPAERWLS